MKFYHVKLTQTQDKCHFGAISKKPSQKPAGLKKKTSISPTFSSKNTWIWNKIRIFAMKYQYHSKSLQIFF